MLTTEGRWERIAEQAHCRLEVPTVFMLAETAGYWQNLHDLLEASRVVPAG